MSSRNTIRFLLDGHVHEAGGFEPSTTVLQYLRETLLRTGTKEGCAEGDCGACTVVIAENVSATLQFRSVNSCIQLLPTLDGKALYTVESLKESCNNTLHPVQQAMVDNHGSQCGFCTPGFVMSLFTLYKNNPAPDRDAIDDALSGNLCRCTGYGPIIRAAQAMYALGDDLPAKCSNPVTLPAGNRDASEDALLKKLDSIKPNSTVEIRGACHYVAPATIPELALLLQKFPGATLLAGGTDVGLWLTKQYRELPVIIYIGNVAGLDTVTGTDGMLEIGATVRLTEAFTELLSYYPHLHEICRRFASPPIRNAATLCGNIANGSPIGDTMPALIALGAVLRLQRGDVIREVPLEEFYLDYQQTDLAEGEFVRAVRVPLTQGEHRMFRSYKNAKRYDQDISAVCAAFNISVEGNVVTGARICFGGMAAVTKRATGCEDILTGKPWNEATLTTAIAALREDYRPLTDMRATADYRLKVAGNLLRRFYLDSTGTEPASLEALRHAG